jgi:hypothetical protein
MTDETDLNQLILEDLGDTLHQRLHTVCRHLPTDFQPYGVSGCGQDQIVPGAANTS